MLDEKQRKILEDLTVETVLALRREYLASPGANALKHWDLLTDRMRLGARRTASAEEWITDLRRSLRLSAPSRDSSRSLEALVSEVREHGAEREFLELIERRHAYLIAVCRVRSEEAREAREQEAGR